MEKERDGNAKDCQVIDLARERRIRFESGKTDGELAAIDFDVYGNPIPLRRSDENRELAGN